MDTGMLWLDVNPETTLSAKIERAAEYYRNKYGRSPNLCMVHPSALVAGQDMPQITIRPWRYVLPGHLFIGIEDGEK